ncbi:MAG TPA: hypothetical protein VKA51_14930 [Rubrobacteraceae bacterium]|nr:hypothetical protein [Rubrobacteraceae bacterium]
MDKLLDKSGALNHSHLKYIGDDEPVEITLESIRLRKNFLNRACVSTRLKEICFVNS